MATTSLPRPAFGPSPYLVRDLLESYTTSHPLRSPSPLPPSSRVNPKLTQRLPPVSASVNPFVWTIPTWISFVRFAVAKGVHVIWSLVKHFLWGPARRSWGYRMTLITSIMRNVADHSSLADIVLVRRLISLHFLIPLPADAVVTPITFVVPRYADDKVARGFLRELDLAETGTRELSGEWVVGTDVWKRLKTERRARQHAERQRRQGLAVSPNRGSEDLLHDPAPTGRDSPDVDTDLESVGTARKGGAVGERVIYYIHGGAYYVGNAATHRVVTIGVSKACNARVFAITYRLAPEHPFPLPLHDVLHGYLRLLEAPLSIPPENIIVAGDSAGGGLSLALCMYLRDEGYKMPGGIIIMSPWVDLTMSCGSWDENQKTDVVPRPEADDHLNPVGCYLGPKGISTYLTHPYASPLFGDLHDLPPMLIQAGDSEVLRDEITLLAHKATLAGVNVTHELYEDMVHVFQMFSWLPAAEAAISSIGRWVRVTVPRIEEDRSVKRPGRLGVQAAEGMTDETEAGTSRVVGPDGEEIRVPVGQVEVTPSEIDAVRDQSALRVRLNLPSNTEEPSIDIDSLPSSGSGSPTPTGSRARSPISRTSPESIERPSAPLLRRALTAFASTPPTSPPAPASHVRRRRPTGGAASMDVSPASSIHNAPSNPASPRRRPKSPVMNAQQHPTTRARSKSHSDIFHLVEGYVDGGPANDTVVYAAGGEVRSVGVLGEEDGL